MDVCTLRGKYQSLHWDLRLILKTRIAQANSVKVSWLLPSFFWAFRGLYSDVVFGHAMSRDDWSFGQVVAVFLLGAPLLSIMETYLGEIYLEDIVPKV